LKPGVHFQEDGCIYSYGTVRLTCIIISTAYTDACIKYSMSTAYTDTCKTYSICTAYTDTCKSYHTLTVYTTVCLKLNLRVRNM